MKRFFKFFFTKRKPTKNYTLEEMLQIVHSCSTQKQLTDINTIFMWCATEFTVEEFKTITLEIHYHNQLLEILEKKFQHANHYPTKTIKFFIEQAATIRELDAIQLFINTKQKQYYEAGLSHFLIIFEQMICNRKAEIIKKFNIENPVLI